MQYVFCLLKKIYYRQNVYMRGSRIFRQGFIKFKLLIKTGMLLKIKDFSCFECSNIVIIILINVKMPTIIGLLTFMSKISFVLK